MSNAILTALSHIRTLVKLLTTNSEARKLVSDFSLVGRDLLSRSAAKAAEGIAPAPEDLARVDESTRRDEFVDPSSAPNPTSNPVVDAVNGTPATTSSIQKKPAPAVGVADASQSVSSPVSAGAVTSDDEIVEEEKKKGLFGKLSVSSSLALHCIRLLLSWLGSHP